MKNLSFIGAYLHRSPPWWFAAYISNAVTYIYIFKHGKKTLNLNPCDIFQKKLWFKTPYFVKDEIYTVSIEAGLQILGLRKSKRPRVLSISFILQRLQVDIELLILKDSNFADQICVGPLSFRPLQDKIQFCRHNIPLVTVMYQNTSVVC